MRKNAVFKFSSLTRRSFYLFMVLNLLFTIKAISAQGQTQRVTKVQFSNLPNEEFQQNKGTRKLIKGVVKDEVGEPLPGVTVKIKGENQGTITDLDGTFKLMVSEDNQLIISYIGMQTVHVGCKGKQVLTIQLQVDSKTLDEVVVTGYQTISRERATGAYAIIKKDVLEKPTTNIASRLIGATSGIQATVDNNGDPKFEIRGLTSLGSNASPLVVVDGFAIDGDFNSVNPNDVESITILKDAAAASIWGARSANGVIVVTTKSGKKGDAGKVSVQYSNFFKFAPKLDLDYIRPYASSSEIVDYDVSIFNKRWGFLPVTDSKQILQVSPNFPTRELLSENSHGYISDEQMHQQLELFKTMDNRSQIKKYLLNNPFTQQHNLSVSFATEKSNTYSSVMYQSRDKELKGNNDEKFLFNLKSEFKFSKRLQFDLATTFMYSRDQNNSSGLPEIHPYQMLVDDNGKRLDLPTYFYMPNMRRYVPMDKFPYSNWELNPITEMENTDISSKNLLARFKAGLKIKIIEGLSFDGNMQYEMNNAFGKELYNDKTFKVRNTINRYTTWDGKDKFVQNVPSGSMLDKSHNEFNNLSMRGMLNFDREFNNKHAIAMVVGTEINSTVRKSTKMPTIYGYDDDKLTVGTFPNGIGSYTNPNLYLYDWMGYKFTIPQTTSFSQFDDRFFSVYGNANYTYLGKYSISASARADASNLITDDPKYRYSPFWSVGLSWQVAREKFMEKYEWIDMLTVNATYGYNGNIDKTTSFKPLINLAGTLNQMTLEPYATIASFGNPTLRWEKTGIFNLSTNFSLFNGKLSGNVNFYNKSGKDLMSQISIPSVYGTTSQKLNTAEMINRGVEIELGSQIAIIPKELTWRGNVNISYNYNKITKLFKSNYSHTDLIPWSGKSPGYVEGENAYSIWGMKYAGLQDVGAPGQPNMQPMIVGKDGVKYGLDKWPAGDPMSYMTNQGTRVAPWIFGFNTGLTYKGIDLSFIVTGKFGHVFQRTFYNYNGKIPNKFLKEVLNSDPMKIMPLPQNDQESRYFFWDRFWPYFDYLTESASHIRMQEVALSYSFPKTLLAKIKVDQFRIFAQANNLFTIYANKYNEDPEFKLGTNKIQPSFTVGCKIGF